MFGRNKDTLPPLEADEDVSRTRPIQVATGDDHSAVRGGDGPDGPDGSALDHRGAVLVDDETPGATDRPGTDDPETEDPQHPDPDGERIDEREDASSRRTGEGLSEVERADTGFFIRPDADHDAKAEGLGDLKRPSWTFAFRNALREFGQDNCTDLAAGLTYYAVLSVFPALIALGSILGVVGAGGKAVQTIKDVLKPFVGANNKNVDTILASLTHTQGAGIALVFGLLVALWSASGYVGAFGRAMNRVYEVDEGRPIWKLRPTQLVVTLITVLLSAVALVILVVSGPVAESVGNVIGLGKTSVLVWNIAKWPVLALVVVFIVALLYYATPNVKQPRFRWLSVGAFVAIVVWLLASTAFAFYVANFGSYNKTYGAVAGVLVALLWLWLTNLALLFGAELDAEIERSRQLQAGIQAEENLQLPLRDDRKVIKAQRKSDKFVTKGRELRERFTHERGTVEDRPYKRN